MPPAKRCQNTVHVTGGRSRRCGQPVRFEIRSAHGRESARYCLECNAQEINGWVTEFGQVIVTNLEKAA